MQRYIININDSFITALERLNALSGDVMTLIAVDDDGHLRGTLTDGDIRRALLGGAGLDAKAGDMVNCRARYLVEGAIDLDKLKEYREAGLRLIPVVDGEGRPVRIINTARTHSQLPLRAILMAGGKGERLRPLTLACPKPLLKIGGKAIIDYNIEALARVGITDVTVTTNYLAEMLSDHFAAPVAGVSVKCVRETMQLGTIGAVSLVDLPEDGDTLVMNSDLLTTVAFEEMYMRHRSEDADITVASVPYTVSVPFAILGTEGNRVLSLQEKPTYTYQANGGIYIISNRLLRELPDNTRTDATDLIDSALERGLKVVLYPVNGTWIDIGSPQDYARACELMKHHHQLSSTTDC